MANQGRARVRELLCAILIGAPLVAASGAHAALIYDNHPTFEDGDCTFGSQCGLDAFGDPSTYSAQAFTLLGPATLTQAMFSLLDQDAGIPTQVDFRFYSVGSDGLPDMLLGEGFSPIVSRTPTIDAGRFTGLGFPFFDYTIDLGDVPLGPGNYYVALHGRTTSHDHYLINGRLPCGDSDLTNGVWHASEGFSYGIALYGAGGPGADPSPCPGPSSPPPPTGSGTPEPATWALMIGGLALVGAALRIRKSPPRFPGAGRLGLVRKA